MSTKKEVKASCGLNGGCEYQEKTPEKKVLCNNESACDSKVIKKTVDKK